MLLLLLPGLLPLPLVLLILIVAVSDSTVAYPVMHVNWDLPSSSSPAENGNGVRASSPLFPPVANGDDDDDSGAFHFSASGKKSCSSDALLSMASSSSSSVKGDDDVARAKQRARQATATKHQQQLRLMREDALGPTVHVQQGKSSGWINSPTSVPYREEQKAFPRIKLPI